jgi:hypothetical protein
LVTAERHGLRNVSSTGDAFSEPETVLPTTGDSVSCISLDGCLAPNRSTYHKIIKTVDHIPPASGQVLLKFRWAWGRDRVGLKISSSRIEHDTRKGFHSKCCSCRRHQFSSLRSWDVERRRRVGLVE